MKWLVSMLGLLAAATQVARADPTMLRMSTIAPDGTAWAREFKAFARDVESATHGDVKVKWYWGGVAGDELEMRNRVAREQLDGVGSGGMLCQKVAPSARVLRAQGLFRNRKEFAHVLNLLRGRMEAETRQAGFVLLATAGIGPSVVYSRNPVRDFAELKATHLWRWDLDEVGTLINKEMGFNILAAGTGETGALFDAKQVDGFIGLAAAGLAFQWSTRARHLLPLEVDYLASCLLISTRSMDRMSIANQQALRSSAAKMGVRFEEVSTAQDEALLSSGLLEKQGLHRTPVSPDLRAKFVEAAAAATERLGDKVFPPALLKQVLQQLADFRAEHPAPK
jgi:TRAP-type transport system periplasmic protein